MKRGFKVFTDGNNLREKKVAIIPGNAFGESGEGFARISYAYSLNTIKKALDRIEEFLKELKA